MICAVCWEPVLRDGPLIVHTNGRLVADDGHRAQPIHREVSRDGRP